MNTNNVIGMFPIDHSIRLYLPGSVPQEMVLTTRQQLAGWFNGAMSYRAQIARMTDAGPVTDSYIVIETYGDDEQVAQHRQDLEGLRDVLAAQLQRDVAIEYNNQLQTTSTKVYSTEEAAEYLGVTVTTIKKHVYVLKDLSGTVKGNSLVFSQEDLDRYRNTRRQAGRPKK